MTTASIIADDPLPAGHEPVSQQPKSAFLPFDVKQMGPDQRWAVCTAYCCCAAIVGAWSAIQYGRLLGVCGVTAVSRQWSAWMMAAGTGANDLLTFHACLLDTCCSADLLVAWELLQHLTLACLCCRLQLLGMMQQLTNVPQASDLGLHVRERSSSALEAAAEDRLLEQQKQQHQMLLHWHQQQQRQAQWQQRHLQQQEQQWQGWQAAQQAMLGMTPMGHAPAMGAQMGVPNPLQAAGLPYAGPLGINWAFDISMGPMGMAPAPQGGSLQLPEDIKPPSVLSGNGEALFKAAGVAFWVIAMSRWPAA